MVKRTCKSGTDVLEEDRERSKQRKRVSGVQIRPSPPSSPSVSVLTVARTRQPRTVHCAEYPRVSNWIFSAIRFDLSAHE
jgi:hypothetical protein